MKKIRFPLEMEDGVEVRTLEDLRESFSLSKVLQYYENGKLVTWLRDRYLDDFAEEVEALDGEDLSRRLCEIFEVPWEEMPAESLEAAAKHNRKLALLREKCSEKEYEKVVDRIAFDQEELYDLLDAGETEIYLLGERFSVPRAKRGIRYVGIGQPTVVIDSAGEADSEEYDIWCVGCFLDGRCGSASSSKKADKRENGNFRSEFEGEPADWKMESFVQELLHTLEEGMEDLREPDFELSDAEMEYFHVEDYGSEEFEYRRKSKAMVACKEGLEELLDDMKDCFDDVKDDMLDEASDFFDDAEEELSDFVEEFLAVYDEYAEEEEPEWREYAKKMRATLFDEDEWQDYVEDMDLESRFQSVAEDFFEEAAQQPDFQKYYNLCEFLEEDGEFAFDLETAYETATKDMEEMLQRMMSFVMSACLSIYLSELFHFEEFIRGRIREAFGIFGTNRDAESGR